MRVEATQPSPSEEMAAPAEFAIHLMMPDFARAEASVIREPIQNMASQAPFSLRTSFQLMTSTMIMTQTAAMATGVAPMCVRPDVAQKKSEPRKTTVRYFSLRDIGPMASSSFCARCLASGMLTSSGFVNLSMTSGTSNRLKRPGTMAALAQPIQVISTPSVLAASATQSGLPAMDVTNIVQVTASQ